MNTTDKIKVLYVDDEQNNLNSFKATFRFDFQVFIALDTTQAYHILDKEQDISVIISDQRMPEKTGVEFFEEIREKYPKPMRILLTGYADIEAVIDAINKGNVFRYIKKPWTDADISTAIEQANKFYITNSLLTEKNKELQIAYNELDKFAYSITHDMRGPLLSVLGALDVIKEFHNMTELRDVLNLMEISLKKLDDFINSVHEYYKVKRGQLVYEEIDFEKTLNDISEIFRVAGRMEKVKYTYEIKQNGPFYSDEVSIKIILNNLLSNAFKYQKKDIDDKYVHVDIIVNDDKVIIFVKDNGIGIHENHMSKIFNMFYRATSQDTGSGFGLFIVKDSLDKLNGEVEVKTALNEGTTFKVTIPAKGNEIK